MFEKLGSKAVAAPLVLMVLLCCVLGLVMAPMLRADPSEVPFIIVNLDEGATTMAGTTNVGETLTEALLDGDSSSLLGGDEEEDDGSVSSVSTSVSMVWTQLDSEEEALAALGNQDYYGAFIIPENFTAQQMSATLGVGDAATITVYLNSGKNAQMASTMQTTLQEAMLTAGIAVDVQTVNDADLGGGTLSGTIGVQMMVMPLMMMCMVGSLLLAMLFWRNDVCGLRRKNAAAAAVVLLVLVAAFSAAAAGCDLCVDIVAGGMDLPVGRLYPFLWAVAGAVMLLFTGLCCLCYPLGALVVVGVFALGMGTALLGPEMLPDFWATYVYPWAPQAYTGTGLRSIIYFGENPLDGDVTRLLIMGGIGLAAVVLAVIVALVGAKRAAVRETGAAEGEDGEAAGEPKAGADAGSAGEDGAPVEALPGVLT